MRLLVGVTDAEDECKTTDSSTENTKKFIAGLQNLLELECQSQSQSPRRWTREDGGECGEH